jgi:type I restriction enzyme M protein
MHAAAQRRLGHALQAIRSIRSIQCITTIDPVHVWRGDGAVPDAYADVAGFCCSAKLDEIEKNGFVLTPGRYVGAADVEDDGEAFEEKMKRLTALLKQQQQEEGAKLDQQIAENLRRLGYE